MDEDHEDVRGCRAGSCKVVVFLAVLTFRSLTTSCVVFNRADVP